MGVGLVASKSWWPPNGRTAVVLGVGRWWLWASTGAGPREIFGVWGMGPRGVALSPSSEVFKSRLHTALSNLVCPHG